MTVGVRDWLKAVREYPAKNQELNELRELLAHSESQLQIGNKNAVNWKIFVWPRNVM